MVDTNMTGPSGPKPRKRFSRNNIFLYGTLILVSMYYLLPLYVMVVTSLKGMPEIRLGNVFGPPMEIVTTPVGVPGTDASVPLPAAWVKAWSEACTGLDCTGLSKGFWNSVQILVPSVILSIAIASVNGYALSNWKFKGSETFFTILIIGAFIPYQTMLYPIVLLIKNSGEGLTWLMSWLDPIRSLFGMEPYGKVRLVNSLTALVFVHTIFGMPILTLLFRNYFASIPEELFKAARVDGARFWQIYFRIMLPMALPIFVVAIILQVTGIWNDFLFGVIYTKSETYPMTVQLNNIVNSVQGVKEYNVNMAATLLTGLVPLVIYFASGKLFVRGIAAGAVKG